MIILAFYPVDNDLGWDRNPDQLACLEQDVAFKKMWEERDGLGARFYHMDTKDYGDPFGQHGIMNADDFEENYNDEELDGGWWSIVFHVNGDFVKEVVGYGR